MMSQRHDCVKLGYSRLELHHCVYKVYKSFPPKICDMFCVVELTIVYFDFLHIIMFLFWFSCALQLGT